ncbi:MAG: iron-sulfur cluster assembly scaffold protein [Bacteroidales bacterium]|nr:iron-sulfur cluster assembly scaffold protein [Bacteroidales bacterium]
MEELLRISGYSDKAIEYYINKVNVGKIEDPSISFSYTGDCGDTVVIYLKIDSDIITNAKFEAIGCAGAFSAGSALMEMIKGENIFVAKNITEEEINEHLGVVPITKTDCLSLVRRALEKTIELFEGEIKR